ncbi:MAG: indole-3-glycerol phosphate synthase TrpC [Megasphaera sp.]|jgi:indole-3-glycerol phosphate synthase|nr:indole-3-glycerol phosphate synthase TrpC [Megasphaera sp.]MCH4187367.1 indole-3-glycerol phosphate synthase TrpC [Megasphaera sp.]MCH4217549.1 indole-3-glycerol phosphate synthase TrpC [Megasphaera sp.]
MILDDLTAAVAKRLVTDKQQISLQEMKQKALATPKKMGFPFEAALRKPGLSFICEVKRASPSKGLIAPDFPYVDIAKEYEQIGAAAISCLTERDYFKGCVQYLQEIAAAVATPVLRKDFIIDEYQIYEARAIGASAILLICAILDDTRLTSFFQLAQRLGLSVLVEAHDAEEIRRAIACGARVIGVNNRNLKDFTVSLQTSCQLRPLVPKEILFVAESGIKTAEHIDTLRQHGIDAVLIGETLMRSADKQNMLEKLRGQRHG